MKRFWLQFSIVIIGLLSLIAVYVYAIDPFYHYHPPALGTSAYFYSQIYQSPGIIKNFDFDSLIVGTSMTENFRTSWFREKGFNTQKISYSGGTTKDLSTLMELAFEKNPQIQFIWTDLEPYQLFTAPDDVFQEIPQYLYNDFLLDDIGYWWNTDVFWTANARVAEAFKGIRHDTDDAYTWEDKALFSKEKVLNASRDQFDALRENPPISQIDFDSVCKTALANITNYTRMITAHPGTQFVFFYPPPSALYWHRIKLSGEEWILDLFEYVARDLLQYDNVQVYYFQDEYKWTTNINNYRDESHHTPAINKSIFEKIMAGEKRLTSENIDAYFEGMRKWLQTYPFESLWEP